MCLSLFELSSPWESLEHFIFLKILTFSLKNNNNILVLFLGCKLFACILTYLPHATWQGSEANPLTHEEWRPRKGTAFAGGLTASTQLNLKTHLGGRAGGGVLSTTPELSPPYVLVSSNDVLPCFVFPIQL